MTRFVEIVREVFQFLETEYEAELARLVESDVGETLLYQNTTTAIQIRHEIRETAIAVDLVRLVDRVLPEAPIMLDLSIAWHWFALNDIVMMRNPWISLNSNLTEKSFHPNDKELRPILTELANAVREYCGDVLNGNFQLFDELEPIVKKRAAKIDALWKMKRLSRSSVQAVNDQIVEEVKHRFNS